MSVLECCRKGCTNIMCDVYVPSVGYVCNKCIAQFKSFIPAGFDYSDEALTDMLKMFVQTERQNLDDALYKSAVDVYFNKFDISKMDTEN